MQLKPWLQLPHPRHVIDDAEEDELPNDYEIWTRIHPISPKGFHDIEGRNLYCVSSRVAPLLNLQKLNLLAKVESGITKVTKQPQTSGSVNLPDLYDYDIERPQSPETLHETSLYRVNEDDVLVVFPSLDHRDCHEFALEVLTGVKPHKVIVVSPCNMISTSGPLYSLHTTKFVENPQLKSQLPPLEPPFYLSGLAASLLSQCESNGTPGIAVVVKAEGQIGFEAVDFDSVRQSLIHVLEQLGLDQSIFSRRQAQSSLYL